MNLLSFLPKPEDLGKLSGIEQDLQRRRRLGSVSFAAALAGLVWNVVSFVQDKNYLKSLWDALKTLSTGGLKGENLFHLIGLALVVLGTLAFALFRWTKLLVRESEEPFRYTFWVEDFKAIEGTPGDRLKVTDQDRMRLLGHDIAEKLKRSLDRLKLLPSDSGKTPVENAPSWSSHIRVSGHFALRQDSKGKWQIQVMPKVCIGPPGSPEFPAPHVRCDLEMAGDNAASLKPETYERVVEEVYSRIAGEIYRQIKDDVERKIRTFPTSYLRGVALFHEAEDFALSNTADGYDLAIELYRQAKDEFQSAKVEWLSRCLMRLPIVWRVDWKSALMEARTRVGFARCVVYRRILYELSGRRQSGTAFEARADLQKARQTLEALYGHLADFRQRSAGDPGKSDPDCLQRREAHSAAYFRYPHDTLWRHCRLRLRWKDFQMIRSSLFDAYVVSAHLNAHLGAYRTAEGDLSDAQALGPDLTDSPSFLLAQAESIPDYQRRLQLLRQAASFDPTFEIAHYLLAHFSEVRLRQRDEIADKRMVEVVLSHYDKVRKINPGNIVARIARGFLLWLSDDNSRSEQEYRTAYEIISQSNERIMAERFTAPLNYGLARIAAEKGDFASAYDHFRRAISSDPAIATFSNTKFRYINSSYDSVSPRMLLRYSKFKDSVHRAAPKPQTPSDPVPDTTAVRTWERVFSFALNDFANAHLNFFHQFGNIESAWEAKELFEEAIRRNPENLVAEWNLASLQSWMGSTLSERLTHLERAKHALPDRVDVTADLVLAHLSGHKTRLKQIESDIEATRRDLEKTETELRSSQDAALRSALGNLASALEPPGQTQQAWGQIGLQPEPSLGQRVGKALDLAITAIGHTTPGRQDGDAVPDGFPSSLPGQDRQKFLRDGSAPRDSQTLIEERKKNQALLEQLEQRRDGVRKDLLTRARSGSREILLQTTLAPSLELSTRDADLSDTSDTSRDLENLLRLLEDRRVQWERLKEDDATALIAVAKVWSSCGIDFLKPVSQILRHSLTHFWPENFDAVIVLEDFLLQKDTADVFSLYSTLSRQETHEVIRNSIEYRLHLQPYSWGWMVWYLHSLSEMPRYYGREDDLAAREAYTNSLGNAYHWTARDVSSANPEKRFRDAIAQFLRIPFSPERQFRIAQSYNELGETDAALLELKRGIDSAPAAHYLYNFLGNIHKAAGRSPDSIVAYRKAIELNPHHPQYHANLGLVLLESDRLSEADQAIQTSLKLAPQNAITHNWLGRLREKQNDLEKAIASYRSAVEILPDNTEFRFSLALACNKREDYDEATLNLSQAIELASDDATRARYSSELGTLHYNRKDYERAITAYNGAVRYQETVAKYHAELGRAKFQWRNFTEALREFTRASELEPKDSGFLFERAVICEGNEDPEGAIRCYEEAIRLKPDHTEAYTALSVLHRKARRWHEAASICERGVASDPKAVATHWNECGLVHMDAELYEKAKECFHKAANASKTTLAYHSRLALCWKHLNRLDEAMKTFDRAIVADPQNTAGYARAKAELLRSAGQSDRAARVLRQGIKLDPSNLQLYLSLAECHWGQKQLGRADAACRKALKAASSIDGVASIVQTYRTIGMTDRALELMESGRSANTAEAGAYSNLIGNFHYQDGKYEAAVEAYARAVAAKPEEALYHSNLAAAYQKLLNAPKALESCRKAAELAPTNDQYVNLQGNVLLDQKQFDQSIQAYLKAIALRPGNAIYHSNLAIAYRGKGDMKKSCAALENALRLNPENHLYHSWMGVILFDMGDYNKARRYSERAVQLGSDVPEYHAELGRILQKLNLVDQAINELEKAQKLSPPNAHAFVNMKGIMRFDQKKFAQAIKYFEEAIQLNNNHWIYHLNLAKALNLEKRPADAIVPAKRAAELSPGNSECRNFYGVLLLDVKKEPAAAVEEFRAAIALHPQNALFRSNLCIALEGISRNSDPELAGKARRESITALQEAIRLDPGNAEYKSRLNALEAQAR